MAGKKVPVLTGNMGGALGHKGAEEHGMNEIVPLDNFLPRTEKEINKMV